MFMSITQTRALLCKANSFRTFERVEGLLLILVSMCMASL